MRHLASRGEPSSGQDTATGGTKEKGPSDGQIRSLNFERRKGQKNTLRTPADEPLPDSTLHAWLGSLQAEEFRRMYALDHATLVEGSESILQASDDIGRMLFQAAAGIEHLGQPQHQNRCYVGAGQQQCSVVGRHDPCRRSECRPFQFQPWHA